MKMYALITSVTLASAGMSPAMIINLNPDAGLSGNASALAAFNRAADAWESRFSDNITININAGLSVLGNPNIIGQAQTTLLAGSYTTIRNAVVSDAADEPSNAIVASLPTAVQFTAQIPNGFSLQNTIVLSRANALALGFSSLPGSNDGTITFNSSFAFDYDNSDGVSGGLVDFETVAAHEIGHVLGFVSAVDDIDALLQANTPGAVALYTMDLFRFNQANLPGNAAQFTSNPRSLVPGANAFFSDTVDQYRLSTGVNLGDGNQASHWKDDGLTGSLIGIMDPTLSGGFVSPITNADLRAFDLMGYDVVIPEPSSLALLAGTAGLMLRRRK